MSELNTLEKTVKQIKNKFFGKISSCFKEDEEGNNILAGFYVGETFFDFSKKEKHKEGNKLLKAIEEMGRSPQHSANITFLIDLASTLPDGTLDKKSLDYIFALMQNLKPKDPIEARLLAQFIVLNEYGMSKLRQMQAQDMTCHAEHFMKVATKMFNLSQQAIQTLIKYRSKGVQQVFVTHVNEGGKAVVAGEVRGEGKQ